MQGKKIIIIGATSGIGKALAEIAAQQGYKVGITGRRIDRLEDLQAQYPVSIHYRYMDVTDHREAGGTLKDLANEMGGMDIIVLNAGISNIQSTSALEVEQKVIDVNVSGFVQLFHRAYEYFKKQGHGHIVGISSVASLLGYGKSAPYNASKAFISTYMQGYRQKARRLDAKIIITDIKAGFVESEMTEGQKRMFWVAPVDKAARQIMTAIKWKRHHAYITKRWRMLAWLIKVVPNWVLDRI